VASIETAVKRLMQRKDVPTALLVVNPYYYLTAISCLLRLGYRVPEDVSVISRDGESYLSYLLPRPAHYVTTPRLFARMLLTAILPLLEGGTLPRRVYHLMPEFSDGESVSAPGGNRK
jgi:DNA-binding LacI/PurR family transcriptional regulator